MKKRIFFFLCFLNLSCSTQLYHPSSAPYWDESDLRAQVARGKDEDFEAFLSPSQESENLEDVFAEESDLYNKQVRPEDQRSLSTTGKKRAKKVLDPEDPFFEEDSKLDFERKPQSTNSKKDKKLSLDEEGELTEVDDEFLSLEDSDDENVEALEKSFNKELEKAQSQKTKKMKKDQLTYNNPILGNKLSLFENEEKETRGLLSYTFKDVDGKKRTFLDGVRNLFSSKTEIEDPGSSLLDFEEEMMFEESEGKLALNKEQLEKQEIRQKELRELYKVAFGKQDKKEDSSVKLKKAIPKKIAQKKVKKKTVVRRKLASLPEISVLPWRGVSKVRTKPFMKGSFLINSVYIARPGDSLRSISDKIFSDENRQSDLRAINPNLKSQLKAGDLVYYSSKNRPNDREHLLNYYEDIGLKYKVHRINAGKSLMKEAQKILKYPEAWKEIWATNLELLGGDHVEKTTFIKYWDLESYAHEPKPIRERFPKKREVKREVQASKDTEKSTIQQQIDAKREEMRQEIARLEEIKRQEQMRQEDLLAKREQMKQEELLKKQELAQTQVAKKEEVKKPEELPQQGFTIAEEKVAKADDDEVVHEWTIVEDDTDESADDDAFKKSLEAEVWDDEETLAQKKKKSKTAKRDLSSLAGKYLLNPFSLGIIFLLFVLANIATILFFRRRNGNNTPPPVSNEVEPLDDEITEITQVSELHEQEEDPVKKVG